VFVDGLDVNCRTPLLLSAAFNLCEAVTMLLDHGAEIRSSDLEGNTALHLAYVFGSMTCVLYLEFRGADSNAKNLKGKTPLEEAGRCALILPLFSATNTVS
jgi:ankyrin repeat domain-containing protein 50